MVKYRRGAGFLLAVLGRRAEASWASFLRDRAVTTAEFTAMAVLAEGAASQRSVAEGMGIDPRNAGATIRRLVDRGWVESAPVAHDRRAKRLSMTESGSRWWAGLSADLAGARSGFFDALSERELGELERLLRKLEAGVSAPPR